MSEYWQARRGRLCLDLGGRFRITVIRIFNEFFVHPAASTIAPPYRSPNEPTGDRSPRNDYPPEMPGIRPRSAPDPNRTAKSVLLPLAIIGSPQRYPEAAELGDAQWDSWQRQEGRCRPFRSFSRLRAAQRRSATRRRSEGASTRCFSCRCARLRAPR